MTSFLLPEHDDWLEQDVDWVPSAALPRGVGVSLLLSSVRTVPQLDAVAAVLDPQTVPGDGPVLPSLVEGPGVDVLPTLPRWYDTPAYEPAHAAVGAAIAVLPTDEADQSLIDRGVQFARLGRDSARDDDGLGVQGCEDLLDQLGEFRAAGLA